ncbi:hypothetical protein C8R41DRAFT_848545 [Lentinula lateritia]|uniref:F-box domain-containing protein n=1 Tax=Lentinula lateritia TaxID=40482 RepID=A0ABQ8V4F1_9AGAR|nr:hypothetical protein C8R41DRAFT_848545 [Lentinula lateritia]
MTLPSPEVVRHPADYSPFLDIFQNKGVLESTAQRQRLRDIIRKSTEEDIPAIDEQIQELLARIRELELTKNGILLNVSKFQEILTPNPIHRLPTEILLEIFFIHRDTTEGYITTISNGVWPLSHVSREWRSITLSLPELWSNIAISAIESPAKNQLQLLNTALNRSGSHPLHVVAHFSWSTGFDDDDGLFSAYGYPQTRNDTSNLGIPSWPSERQLSEAMIKSVVGHSNRWKTADISVLDPSLLRPIYGQLASLEKLTFAGDLDDFPQILSIAPKLRDIEFHNSDSSSLQLPWTQIFRFRESQWNPSMDLLPRYLRILRQNTQFEDFGVEYESIRSGNTPQLLTHSKLKAFMCTDIRLIRCLTLPNLQSLHLKAPFMRMCPSDMIPASSDLLSRSRCASNMRVLRLEGVVLNRDVLSLLESTASLTELNFTFDKWVISNDTFLKVFIQRLSTHGKSRKDMARILLPKLESLTIDIEAINSHEWFVCNIQFIDDSFVEMVEARWKKSGNGISQLRVVKFEGYTPATLSAFTVSGVTRMKKMRDEGLETYIATMDINSTDDDRKEKTYIR